MDRAGRQLFPEVTFTTPNGMLWITIHASKFTVESPAVSVSPRVVDIWLCFSFLSFQFLFRSCLIYAFSPIMVHWVWVNCVSIHCSLGIHRSPHLSLILTNFPPMKLRFLLFQQPIKLGQAHLILSLSLRINEAVAPWEVVIPILTLSRANPIQLRRRDLPRALLLFYPVSQRLLVWNRGSSFLN